MREAPDSKQAAVNPANHIDLPVIDQKIPLRDKVYEILRDRILKGKLPAGYALIANQLATQLGVSRTPIREALQRLQVEGLVVAGENGISIVPMISVETIESTADIREVLEVFACRRAAAQITESGIRELRRLHEQELDHLDEGDDEVMSNLNSEIHRKIAEVAENPVLIDIFEYLKIRVPSFRLFALGARSNLRNFVEEHGLIIEAIAAGDQDKAGRLMAEHVQRAKTLFSENYRSSISNSHDS